VNWIARNQLVKIELAAILIFHLALISMAFLALMMFTLLGEGGVEIIDPLEAKVFTPIGLLLCAIVLGLPGLFLGAISWSLHHFVVVPRAAEIEESEDPD
jgi:hypothetical protein